VSFRCYQRQFNQRIITAKAAPSGAYAGANLQLFVIKANYIFILNWQFFLFSGTLRYFAAKCCK